METRVLGPDEAVDFIRFSGQDVYVDRSAIPYCWMHVQRIADHREIVQFWPVPRGFDEERGTI